MTNREILIKLAAGKKFRRKDNIAGEFVIRMDDTGFIVTDSGKAYYDLCRYEDWKEFVEPLRWEGNCQVGPSLFPGHAYGTTLGVTLPLMFESKRVKVIVEEIV